MTVLRLGALLLVAVLATSCRSRPAPAGSVTVAAAASLTDVFQAERAPFLRDHRQAKLTFTFGGSQRLAAQVEAGAPIDVIATADTETMDGLVAKHLAVGAPAVFAANRLAIVVGRGNPEHVRGLADLARAGLHVVLAGPNVPAGRYAAEALKRAGDVRVAPVSLEDDVRGVVTKVRLGEADAGVVYETDVRAAGAAVEGVPIPDRENVRARYPMAEVSGRPNRRLARAFVEFMQTPRARAVMARFGFLAP